MNSLSCFLALCAPHIALTTNMRLYRSGASNKQGIFHCLPLSLSSPNASLPVTLCFPAVSTPLPLQARLGERDRLCRRADIDSHPTTFLDTLGDGWKYYAFIFISLPRNYSSAQTHFPATKPRHMGSTAAGVWQHPQPPLASCIALSQGQQKPSA